MPLRTIQILLHFSLTPTIQQSKIPTIQSSKNPTIQPSNHPTTDNPQQTTDNRQQTTHNRQQTTHNPQPTTHNRNSINIPMNNKGTIEYPKVMHSFSYIRSNAI